MFSGSRNEAIIEPGDRDGVPVCLSLALTLSLAPSPSTSPSGLLNPSHRYSYSLFLIPYFQLCWPGPRDSTTDPISVFDNIGVEWPGGWRLPGPILINPCANNACLTLNDNDAGSVARLLRLGLRPDAKTRPVVPPRQRARSFLTLTDLRSSD